MFLSLHVTQTREFIRRPVLVVGTHNHKKREELVAILTDVGWEIRDLSGWPDTLAVIEDGSTFLENASKKAVELARHLGNGPSATDTIRPSLGQNGVALGRVHS